jgi:hypothetical protein
LYYFFELHVPYGYSVNTTTCENSACKICSNYLSLAQINGHMSAKQELAQGMD